MALRYSPNTIRWMRQLPYKQSPVRGQDPSGKASFPPPISLNGSAYKAQLEVALQLRPAKWNTGTAQDANPRLTPTESGKPECADSGYAGTEPGVSQQSTLIGSGRLKPVGGTRQVEKLPEAQEVLHELACGEKLEYLPEWVFDAVNVPAGWYCIKCDRVICPGIEITYLG